MAVVIDAAHDMTVAIATPLSQIELIPGSALQISGVNWASYIALMQELGDDRATRITIKHLSQGQYVDAFTSLAFPTISATQINQWLELRRTGTDLTVVRAVRQFCRNSET